MVWQAAAPRQLEHAQSKPGPPFVRSVHHMPRAAAGALDRLQRVLAHIAVPRAAAADRDAAAEPAAASGAARAAAHAGSTATGASTAIGTPGITCPPDMSRVPQLSTLVQPSAE